MTGIMIGDSNRTRAGRSLSFHHHQKGFSTAMETSGNHLIANRIKGKKAYELTFQIRQGGDREGITDLAICVLSRNSEEGTIILTTTLTDDSTQILSANFPHPF